ncbi:hypothetical protein [Nocardia aurantia]|uniref:Uncharacterized protein n=1 Tax=Nocardia aurantia TaxID=2585199 RepID=A0A7K0DHG9_9NOCA|nr:hypothetical protein [Nocardia aurantia]MQY25263.1 hypothetical protein [Nocardia aurantia]
MRAPGVFAPITLTVDVDGRPASLRTALPDFDWADRDSRWRYIIGDLLPRYLDLRDDPTAAGPVLAAPFPDKLARGRMLPRLPELLADLTGGWRFAW